MKDDELVCHACGATYPFEIKFEPCGHCGGPLHVSYADRPMNIPKAGMGTPGIGKHRAFLPVPKNAKFISLGEGDTPLLNLPAFNRFVGTVNVRLKNEAANPSWSFKDRLNSVNATIAKAHGFPGIVATSTGNHGASAAAYPAAAGLKSIVLFPHGTPDIYPRQVQAYGGTAVVMDWKERGSFLERLVRDHGWYPSKSTLPAPLSNPFGTEGYKTIAYELANASNGAPPDLVFVPAGSGDNLFGISRGFSELVRLGAINRMPKLVACEASGSSPLTKAFRQGDRSVTAIQNPRTNAVSISEGIVSNLALFALQQSDGDVCTVSEEEITDAGKTLAGAGILAETSSCVAAAAVAKYAKSGKLCPSDTAVAILTATGIRWPAQVPNHARQPVALNLSRDMNVDPELLLTK